MRSIKVSANDHAITFSRGDSFITSVPIRRLTQPGEILDLVRRLTLAVNSDGPGSLLHKIDAELKMPYNPSAILIKSHATRLKNFRNRVKAGRGHLSKAKARRSRSKRGSPRGGVATAARAKERPGRGQRRASACSGLVNSAAFRGRESAEGTASREQARTGSQ